MKRSNAITLVSIKKTKTLGQYTAEFSQMVNTSNTEEMTSSQLIGFFQKGNPNVSSPKERRAWVTVTEDFLKLLEVDVNSLTFDEENKATLMISDPKINGMYLNIEIVECKESDLSKYFKGDALDYKIAFKKETAKRIPDTNEYFVKDGELVFSWGRISAAKDPDASPKHVLIKDAVKTPESELFKVTDKLTEGLKTE